MNDTDERTADHYANGQVQYIASKSKSTHVRTDQQDERTTSITYALKSVKNVWHILPTRAMDFDLERLGFYTRVIHCIGYDTKCLASVCAHSHLDGTC